MIKRLIAFLKGSQLCQNICWNVIGSSSARVLGPVFLIIVARLLTPEDFGVFAIAVATLAFLQISKDLGLTQAVIVSDNKHDYLSIQFSIQLIWGGLLYLALFFGAPFIGAFFNVSGLAPVLRLLGLNLFINAFSDPLIAYYMKTQNYKVLFFRQLIPSLIGGFSTLILVLCGLKVYGLVIGTLTGSFILSIFFLYNAPHPPKLLFNWPVLRKLLTFGKHAVFQEFCGFLVLQADSLVVGKNLGPNSLGLYRLGNTYSQVLPNTIVAQVQQVFFTDLTTHKGDIDYLNRRYYHFIYYIGATSILFSLIIFASSPLIIPLILGNKWHKIIEVVQIFSVLIPVIPIVVLNVDISKIYGFYNIYSYFFAIRSIITIISVYIASTYSFKATLFTWLLIGLISAISNAMLFFYCQKIIKPSKIYIYYFVVIYGWAAIVLALLIN